MVLAEYDLEDANPFDFMTETTLINEKDNLVYLASKALLLSSIMIISTQIVRIFVTIFAVLTVIYGEASNISKSMLITSRFLRNIDCLINSLCVFLYFKFTSQYYDKLCVKCHYYINKIWINKIDNKSRLYDSISF